MLSISEFTIMWDSYDEISVRIFGKSTSSDDIAVGVDGEGVAAASGSTKVDTSIYIFMAAILPAPTNAAAIAAFGTDDGGVQSGAPGGEAI